MCVCHELAMVITVALVPVYKFAVYHKPPISHGARTDSGEIAAHTTLLRQVDGIVPIILYWQRRSYKTPLICAYV
jgi:hypothetical protein